MARLGVGFCWRMVDRWCCVFLFAPIVIIVAVSFSPSTILHVSAGRLFLALV